MADALSEIPAAILEAGEAQIAELRRGFERVLAELQSAEWELAYWLEFGDSAFRKAWLAARTNSTDGEGP